MKKMIIATVVVLVLMGAGVGYFLTKKKTTPAQTTTTDQSTTKSESVAKKVDEDLGACSGVDMATITSSLGAAAAKMASPSDSGTYALPNDVKGQTCTYPLVEGADRNNSFTIDVTSYAAQESFDAAVKSSVGTSLAVTGVGDTAHYAAVELQATKSKQFILTVTKAKKIYQFAINQPSDAITFTDASAKAALVKIATATKL